MEAPLQTAAMLATLAGLLALVVGLVVVLVPLLIPELSRQRDAVWGAVLLLLGLTLVTSSERLVGAPMLAVLCGTVLIGRLGLEVGQGRWRALSSDERQALVSLERWQTSLQQLLAAAARLVALGASAQQLLLGWVRAIRTPKTTGKRWIRPDEPAEVQAANTQSAEAKATDGEPVEDQPDDHQQVSSLAEIDALLEASTTVEAADPPDEAG